MRVVLVREGRSLSRSRSSRPQASMRLPLPSGFAIALLIGCSGRAVPDPRTAAEEYAQAASRGDGDAIYEMMTTSAQKSRSREDVKRLVAEQRGELAEQAKSLTAKDARVEAVARLRYDDGEEAPHELREGRGGARHLSRIRTI